ncbi:hypothetical protein A1F96_11176 [Pyrenophora tritici-repentis]|nr:hypothetical protein PtrCC142_011873 [Pyrenophora tritici-repentis]PZD22379.1 hypothetical protein A1F96_11176 [Pyrenophora tritici-repentis]
MSHITFVPSTPRLDALAATVILDDRRPFIEKKGTRLDQYAHSPVLDDIKQEVIRMGLKIKAKVQGLEVELPVTKPMALIHISGRLTTGESEIAIIKILMSSENISRKTLKTWHVGDSNPRVTDLDSGLIIIYPNVRYEMPEDVPFCPLFSQVSPGAQTVSHS